MDNKLINAVIQITSKEEKSSTFGPMAKIKDEKGLTYTVYKTKKDGTVSVAWEQLQKLNVGDMVQASYVEEIKAHPEHGKYTARTVRAFDLDIANGMANTSAMAEKGQAEAPRSSQNSSSDAFGRRLGVQGHINALLSNSNYYSIGHAPSIALLVKEAIAVEDEAEKQLATAKPVANLEPDLPVIQQEDLDDIGSDIPF